jgi:hypothetical protein
MPEPAILSTPVVTLDTSTTPPISPPSETQGDGTPVGDVGTPVAPKVETSWRDSLPSELKDDANIKNYKDLTTFAKSHVELRKTLGEKVSIPKADASEEVKAEFYEKLGIPKTTEGYAKVQPPVLPEGMELQDTNITEFKEVALKAHMTPEQVQAVMNYYGEMTKGVMPNYKADREATTTQLQDEWGPAVDRNIGVARRAYNADFTAEVRAKLDQAGISSDKDFVKAMYNRGRSLIEDGVIPTEVGQGMDNNTAQLKLDEIMNDPKHPYFTKGAPGHDAAVSKVRSLNQLIYS